MNNKTNIIATALALALSLPISASEDSKPQAGRISQILQDINMFTPEPGAPAYKITANERYGTQWAVDAAYAL